MQEIYSSLLAPILRNKRANVFYTRPLVWLLLVRFLFGRAIGFCLASAEFSVCNLNGPRRMFFAVLIFPNITLHFAGQKNFLTFLEILIDEFGGCAPRRAAEKIRFVTNKSPVNGNREICNRNAVVSLSHFGVSSKTAFDNDSIHVLFSFPPV